MTYTRPMSRDDDFKASKDYDPRAFPPVAVTVDIVVLTIREARMMDGRMRGGQLSVLLLQRSEAPFKGYWALPGGFVRPDETLEEAAMRDYAAQISGKLLIVDAFKPTRREIYAPELAYGENGGANADHKG